jgi:hypothetical protein
VAQIARLLGEPSLRAVDDEAIRSAIEQRFEVLVAGLADETAASDDVFSRESALAYLDSRLAFLSVVIDEGQKQRLREALQEKLQAW